MSRILIVYGSRYGQTRRVADRIRQVLTSARHSVDFYQADEPPPSLALERYGAVVVAAPVFFGKHQASVMDFIGHNAAQLNSIPAAFLSVSGSRGREAQAYVSDMITRTGWSPVLAQPVEGAVAYTRYNPILRWVMRQISRHKGYPTDVSRDHELTDWSGVEQFARGVERLLPRNRPPARMAEVGAGEIV